MRLSTEGRVGAVTLVGLALLAYMIIHLGNFNFQEDGYPLQAVFGQVSGLKQGNIVRYAGVEVGSVKGIQVKPDGVLVQMLIHSGVAIPEGSSFVIGTDGLLGEKFIEIYPASQASGFLAPNAVVRGQDPQGLEHLIASADKVLLDVQKLVQSLNDVFGDEKVKASFKDTVINAKEITANLNALTATLARMAAHNEGNVDVIAGNLRDVSGNLSAVTARVDKLIAGVDNNGQTAADLRETLANIKNTSSRIEKMAASLEGVVTDPQTGENLRQTLKNTREASEKANKMLSKVNSLSAETNFEVLYSPDAEKYQSNADIKINTSPNQFAVVGVHGIGDGNRGNLQVGTGDDRFDSRLGIVEGKPGAGIDAKLGNQMRFSVDVYDPNDVRVKLRSEYQLNPDTFLVGQTDNVNKETDRSTYFGVKHTF
ncbi:MlaD family protein [Propionispora vibrioides]|uniref:Phospholipid/cholesterol/gamma-HCH transport system substrate-binding protein n=1 Tax=Propionispora vibrioides TaxID=112903 RepID=A0A1H8PR42_9FIRM|nr:MlaD family protein [Propionispora vibrioides]SEO44256.1 phospholipid/cholesterol/gamma-HCH transport system substrate-binding protein [Propionispora vibrioides]